MSCPNCEKIQEEGIVTYIRIGNGNVMVSGCDKHLREMFEMLRSCYITDDKNE